MLFHVNDYIMVRKCVMCNMKEVVACGVSFHSFPKDQSLRKMWMQKCSIKLCLPSYRICSNHFLPEDILCYGLLKKNAIPITNKIVASSASTSQLIDDSDLTGHEIGYVNRFITSSQPEIASSLNKIADEHSVSPGFQASHISDCQITSTFVRKSLIKTPNDSSKRNSSVSSSLLKRQKVLNPRSIGDLEVDHFPFPKKSWESFKNDPTNLQCETKKINM